MDSSVLLLARRFPAQVDSAFQRMGLGSRLMHVVESVAWSLAMSRCVLTEFSANKVCPQSVVNYVLEVHVCACTCMKSRGFVLHTVYFLCKYGTCSSHKLKTHVPPTHGAHTNRCTCTGCRGVLPKAWVSPGCDQPQEPYVRLSHPQQAQACVGMTTGHTVSDAWQSCYVPFYIHLCCRHDARRGGTVPAVVARYPRGNGVK